MCEVLAYKYSLAEAVKTKDACRLDTAHGWPKQRAAELLFVFPMASLRLGLGR